MIQNMTYWPYQHVWAAYIALINPTDLSLTEHSASLQISQPLASHILQHLSTYPPHIKEEQFTTKASNRIAKCQRLKQAASDLSSSLSPTFQCAMAEFGFALHKGAFRDAVVLCYCWPPLHAPTTSACGMDFTLDHSLSCSKDGFPSIKHNKIRDVTAFLLFEVCHNVAVEPHLQPLEGETFSHATASFQESARLDIVASGFWGGRFERSFFDVRVFNPHATSNQHLHPESVYRRHEALKRRTYEQRVREVEHASFTPLVMSHWRPGSSCNHHLQTTGLPAFC